MNTEARLDMIAEEIRELLENRQKSADEGKTFWRSMGAKLVEARKELPGDLEFGQWCDRQDFKTGKKKVSRPVLYRYRTAAEFARSHESGRIPDDVYIVHYASLLPPDKQAEVLDKWAKGECLTRKPFMEAYSEFFPEKGAPKKLNKEADKLAAGLNMSQQERYEKALAKKERAMKLEFEAQVAAKAALLAEQKNKEYDKWITEVMDEKLRYEKLIQNVNTIFTYDEYKFLRGCIHPDRGESPEQREKFNLAYTLFCKLEPLINKHVGRDLLRGKGLNLGNRATA